MLDFSNADFDVNIIEDPLGKPTIPLTFPLPIDKDHSLDLEFNPKVTTNWKIIQNFIKFTTGINWEDIYSNNEHKFSINKYSPEFNKYMEDYMREKLEKTDEQLDEHVEALVNQEIRLNLIKRTQFKERFHDVKLMMVKYYTEENKKNLPRFMGRNFLRICYTTMLSLFKKVYPKGIWCNRLQISDLYKKYLDDPMSLIYLPNHQSHIDYIVVHILTIRFQLAAPMVIAGDNLNVAVFGKILKGFGAIFIQRSFNDEVYTERNLANFIEFTLLNKIPFEVYIEGTRSRDGKLLLPKYGILKTLSNIYLKQREIDDNVSFDMRFVPMSITYERIYEADGYLRELMGKDKKQESTAKIFKNGVTELMGSQPEFDFKAFVKEAQRNKGDYDNSTKKLLGKIFVKLGNTFKLSQFVEDDLKSTNIPLEMIPGSNINLKKLGFTVLHEINRARYLPEISIIGSAIQTHFNMYKKCRFAISELMPIFKVLLQTFEREEEKCNNISNVSHLNNLLSLSDSDKILLVKQQIPLFFRAVKVNYLTDEIVINDSMELLYYKNLTIHITIHQALTSFLLLSLAEERRTTKVLHQLYYIFTGFLKSEFLFDYDFNPEHQLSNVLKCLSDEGRISLADGKFLIKDEFYLSCFGEIVKPFIEAYLLCIFNLDEIIGEFSKLNGFVDIKKLLIDDTGIDYPHTKTLLKKIQSRQGSQNLSHVESTNKQYLLSCLYYLDNLKLISIVKNKARTKAFVVVANEKDMAFIHHFLVGLLNGNSTVSDRKVAYMIDIIDKNHERQLEEKVSQLSTSILKSRL